MKLNRYVSCEGSELVHLLTRGDAVRFACEAKRHQASSLTGFGKSIRYACVEGAGKHRASRYLIYPGKRCLTLER